MPNALTEEPWTQRQATRLENALRYYMGPAYAPVEMAGRFVSGLLPGADMIDAAQSSGDLMRSGSWGEAGRNALGLGAATLGMAIPGTARGIEEGVEEAAQGLRTVYHGTPNPDVASGKAPLALGLGQRTDYGNFGTGVYTTPKEFLAKAYAEKGGQRGGVLKLQADLKNPLYVTVAGPEYTDEVERIARELGVTAKPVWEGSGQKSREFADQFREKAMAAGYDGVITKDIDGAEGAELVAFDPASLRKYGENALSGIRAYHGSPHDFDRFSMDKIGTGEGAQAYGHGLYFASNEDVARSYRESLSGRWHNQEERRALLSGQDHVINAAKMMFDDGMSPEQVAPILRSAYGVSEDVAGAAMHSANPGRMYEVNIAANPDDFLDWDKPLSEQSEKVRGAITSVAPHLAQVNPAHVRGEDAYRGITGKIAELVKADPRSAGGEVAMALRDAGVSGLRYLDQGSRAAGDGSRNYVVFDDNLISILRKYGLLGGIGLGAMGSNALRDDDT